MKLKDCVRVGGVQPEIAIAIFIAKVVLPTPPLVFPTEIIIVSPTYFLSW